MPHEFVSLRASKAVLSLEGTNQLMIDVTHVQY